MQYATTSSTGGGEGMYGVIISRAVSSTERSAREAKEKERKEESANSELPQTLVMSVPRHCGTR